ncbi:MAG: hypothetical protein HOO96_38405, partial [Polyangiaceae bacterium]|nr:hypothetical protein [Polyangiaceae bacterium]
MTLARLRFAVAAALAASPGTFACGGAVAPEPLPSASSGSSSSSSSSGSSSSSSSSSTSSGNPPTGCVVTLPPDAPTAPCGFGAQISGDPRICGFASDGYQAAALCARYCGGPMECAWYAGSAASLMCGNGCEGRRPAGLGGRVLRYLDELAEYFARAAYLEAASVPAFSFLHEELVLHGAPRALAARALTARADEVRHARLMGWLARRLGVTPEAPAALRRKPRTLLDMAIENAVEG